MSLDNIPAVEVTVDLATSGDNVIIAGVAGQTIRVFKLFLVLGGDTLLTFKHGTTEFDGPLTMFAGGAIVFDEPRPPRHWFKTGTGEDFIINLSNAVQLSGRVYYTQSA
jgi:hypothetical protein